MPDNSSSSVRRRRSRTLRLVIVATAVVAGCYFWWQHTLSDDYQISKFRAHKAEYEAVLNMFQRDKNLEAVNAYHTVPEDPSIVGITPQRIAAYRSYMSALGCSYIGYEPVLGTVVFVNSAIRAPDIIYAPIQSSAMAIKYGVPVHKAPPQSHHIEGNWYLSSESFP